VIAAQRTAKWTAITDRRPGTYRHSGALDSQVEATHALAGGLPDLHGMQEARGSSPLSSTFQQVKGMLRAWKITSERLQPSKLSEAQVFVWADVDAGQEGACTPGRSCAAAFSLGQPN